MRIKTIACFWGILSFFSLQAQVQLNKLGQVTYIEGLNDIWGYVDASGNEYALVGLKNGVSIVDVTNPANPQEVQFVEGLAYSIWRDIKTWQHYAYVVHDSFSGSSDGLMVIDMNQLGSENAVSRYYGLNDTISSVHNLWIDEFGKLFLLGYNSKNSVPSNKRGALILDLAQNPLTPPIVGAYSEQYLHDAYVRNNIMYGSEVYKGQFSVVDISNPAEPILLATQPTPGLFTHNVWLSDNSQILFTTDEKNDEYLAAYDIGDLSDIKETARYQSSVGENVMPHNAHVYNDYVVISYYKDGVRIVDGNNPDNLVEVAYYDTSPLSGSGSQGCWGAYPFLPSGNILASDREEGLFVLAPHYERAAYVEGHISNAQTNVPLVNVEVSVENYHAKTGSDFQGFYKTGAIAGNYDITFSLKGFIPKTINIDLNAENTTTLDVSLDPIPKMTGYVEVLRYSSPNTALANARVEISNDLATYSALTDENGIATFAEMYEGTYALVAGKWGYDIRKLNNENFMPANDTLTLELYFYDCFNCIESYVDDFALDLGWEVWQNADNGNWTREKPVPVVQGENTLVPGIDATDDYGNQCYMTGNAETPTPISDDLDGGSSILLSPEFVLHASNDASCEYALEINANVWASVSDTNMSALQIQLIDAATGEVLYEPDVNFYQEFTNQVINAEAFKTLQLYIPETFVTDNMMDKALQLQFVAYENPEAEAEIITEYLIDKVRIFLYQQVCGITENTLDSNVIFYPNPFINDAYIVAKDKENGIYQAEISVFNILGEKVAYTPYYILGTPLYFLQDLPKGIYYLNTCFEGKKVLQQKIVKSE